ncbi:MAG TPA: thiolase domain-containing protein, partial [Ureibacillus sp.]|nr:thiolase domain-containing protein [Ureibacillus sp.]
MSIKGVAYIAGAYEHPLRKAPNTSVAALHADCARGALADAGLTFADVDGYFCAGDAPGGVLSMVDYLGLHVRHLDGTDIGGSSYIAHVSHAAQAIAAGKCKVALITMAGRPRSE